MFQVACSLAAIVLGKTKPSYYEAGNMELTVGEFMIFSL